MESLEEEEMYNLKVGHFCKGMMAKTGGLEQSLCRRQRWIGRNSPLIMEI